MSDNLQKVDVRRKRFRCVIVNREMKDMLVRIDQAKIQLPELIEAAVRGEEVVIAKEDQHIVKLVPIFAQKNRPQFGSAKGPD